MKINRISLYKVGLFLMLMCCIITMHAQHKKEATHNIVYTILEDKGLVHTDFSFQIDRTHTSSTSGVQHIYFSQRYRDIPILGTASSVHIVPNNSEPLTKIQFVSNFDTQLRHIHPALISLDKAIQLSIEDIQNASRIDLGNLFLKDENSLNSSLNPLSYWRDTDGQLHWVWNITIMSHTNAEEWEVWVHATTGEVVQRTSNRVTCFTEDHEHTSLATNNVKNEWELPQVRQPLNCTNCYEVFEIPKTNPYNVQRTVVVNPANMRASPFGWHDIDGIDGADVSVTMGNNVEAQIDNSEISQYRPDGGGLLQFTGYNFNQYYSTVNPYYDASATNLFYWGNIIHDVLYVYGFNEEAGNFQENNYGKGGLGEDPMIASGQRTTRLCNATYSFARDGSRGSINMNICENTDSNFDTTVIIHEYIHGLVTRLFGTINCVVNAEQMSEGWCDWYALMLTMKSEDTRETPRAIAAYFRGQGPNGTGVREYPYTTQIATNPLTYDDIKGAGVHRVGAVWASMLWDLTWNLIDAHGYDSDIYNYTIPSIEDAGNTRALAIVTEAIKITPCQPHFGDARDAIIEANRYLYSGESEELIVGAFTKRGLGPCSYHGDSDNTYDGYSSFTTDPLPAKFENSIESTCEGRENIVNLSGGLPIGGVYTGIGVTDNGDGFTYSFNPSIAGTGTHTITYTLEDSSCSMASSATSEVVVQADNEPPVISCRTDFDVRIYPGQEGYKLSGVIFNASISDNCYNSLTVSQEPPVGSILDVGTTEVTIYALDGGGNQSECRFNVNVSRVFDNFEDGNGIRLQPNPTYGKVYVSSSTKIEALQVTIRDINSKLLRTIHFNSFGFESVISLDRFASGLYFLKFEYENTIQINKIVKR